MKHLKAAFCRSIVCAILALSMLLPAGCNAVPIGANADDVSSAASETAGESARTDTAGTGADQAEADGDTAAADAGTDTDAAADADPGTETDAGEAAADTEDPGTDRIHFIRLDTDITSDSFLIESEGKYMLVDTSNPDPTTNGNYSVYVNTENVKAVVDYLSSLGIHHLDYLIMTHNHTDHIGGVKTLCDLHFIDDTTIVYSRTGKETQEDIDTPEWQNQYYYQLAVEALDGVGAEFHSLLEENVTDLTIQMGNFAVKFMNLDLDGDGQVDFDDQNENNNSLVLKVTKGNMDTLLTADIETEQEYAMVDACGDLGDIEVLKAPHHGSTTSSSYEFLKAIQPQTVIVTSFRYRQGGAHQYVQNVLGADLYVTKDCTAGAIVETVYNDRYTIDNGVIFEDAGGSQEGWLSWFDYFMYIENGVPVTDSWKQISGGWHHFNADGIMQTGAVTIDGKNYYLGDDGVMQTGFVTVDGRRHFYAPWNGAEITFPPFFGGKRSGAAAASATDTPGPAANPVASPGPSSNPSAPAANPAAPEGSGAPANSSAPAAPPPTAKTGS